MKERKQIHWNSLHDIDPEDMRAEPIQNPVFKTNVKRQEDDYRQEGHQCDLTLNDVKAMRTTSDEDGYEHLKNSLAVFRALEEKVARYDYEYANRLIAELKYEQLEMYTMNLIMGIQ